MNERRRRKAKIKRIGTIGFFLAPALIFYSLFWIVPIFGVFMLSVVRWKGVGEIHYVGLANFVRLFTKDSMFWISVRNNLIYGVLTLVFAVGIGLVLALLFDQKIKGGLFFRTALFLPFVLAWIVVGFLWTWLYNPVFGLINTTLKGLHIDFLIRNWLGDETMVIYAVSIVAIWKNFPFAMVIFLAGLAGIPQQCKEAAYIDGASEWTCIAKVVLPLLAPAITIVVVLTLIDAFRVFDVFYVMGGYDIASGGNIANVLSLQLYRHAMIYNRMGYGSAYAVILFLLTLSVAIGYLATLGRRSLEG